VLLAAANPRRRSLEIYADSSTTFYFGFDQAVNASTGYEAPGLFAWAAGTAPGGAVYAYAANTVVVVVREQTDQVAF
jgi:hypothetical protein